MHPDPGCGRASASPHRHPLTHDLDDRPLGASDVLVPVRELAEHPPGEDLLDPAVEDPGKETRVEVAAERALALAAGDDPLDRRERLPELVDLRLHLRA